MRDCLFMDIWVCLSQRLIPLASITSRHNLYFLNDFLKCVTGYIECARQGPFPQWTIIYLGERDKRKNHHGEIMFKSQSTSKNIWRREDSQPGWSQKVTHKRKYLNQVLEDCERFKCGVQEGKGQCVKTSFADVEGSESTLIRLSL